MEDHTEMHIGFANRRTEGQTDTDLMLMAGREFKTRNKLF